MQEILLPIIAALSGIIYNRIVLSIKEVKKDLDTHKKESEKTIQQHEQRIHELELSNQYKFKDLEKQIISLEKKVESLNSCINDFIHEERNLYQSMKDVILRIHNSLE
jgi:TolA-binding protein